MLNRLNALFIAALSPIILAGACAPGQDKAQPYRIDLPDIGPSGELGGVFWGGREDGLRCGRLDKSLYRYRGEGPVTKFDFDALAHIAIERDILRGKWDGSWDTSTMVDTSVLFDADGRAYTLLVPRYSNLKHAALLWSVDGCRTWHARALTGVNATLEKPDSFNDRTGPPTVLSFESYGHESGTRLWLESFRGRGAALLAAPGTPALVAVDSELVANHSGGGNSTFTTRHMIHVVYPTTDPGEGAGTLSVGRSFDRDKGVWTGPPVPIGRSTTRKGPDDHDLPAITFGPDGRAVVVVGAHHAVLEMYTAKQPASVTSGWSRPEPVGDPQRGAQFAEYSYASLNMSKTGTINIVSRNEGDNGYYQLIQFRRLAGGSWTDWPGGLPHRLIATPSRHAYGSWRQRVNQMPDGELVLSFSYFPNQLTDAEAANLHLDPHKDASQCDPHTHRCWYVKAPIMIPRTLVSRDEGKTWHSGRP